MYSLMAKENVRHLNIVFIFKKHVYTSCDVCLSILENLSLTSHDKVNIKPKLTWYHTDHFYKLCLITRKGGLKTGKQTTITKPILNGFHLL